MAIVTSDLISGITTNFRALWEDAFLAARDNPILRAVLGTAMEVPSSTLIESYNWLGEVPKMREWLSERVLQGLPSSTYSLTNRHYEATLEIDRDTIEDDRLGIIRPRISQLSMEAARYPVERLTEVILAGNTAAGLAYDGQQFFDTDHVTPGADFVTPQSNKLTGTGITDVLLRADYQLARAAMINFKDVQGRPMGLLPTHVMCPPALEGLFRQILNSDYYPTAAGVGAAANVWKGSADLILNPYLTDATDWYLLALDQPVKPFIYQNRKAAEFSALDDPNSSDTVFMKRKFLYGVDSRFNMGYGLWATAILTVNGP